MPLVLVPALGLAQGGFDSSAWVWAGALAAWAAALGLVLTGGGALRAAWGWPAAGAALLLWTLASTLWSASPTQSVLEARRTLVYVAVVLAFVVLARRGATWPLVVGTHLALTGLLGYALVRYLLGTHAADTFEGYHLSEPLGYANAIGILAVLGALLALAPAVGSDGARRVLAAATVPLFAFALAFTGSNASWAALGVGAVAAVACSPAPVSVVRAVALLAAPSAATRLARAPQPLRRQRGSADRRGRAAAGGRCRDGDRRCVATPADADGAVAPPPARRRRARRRRDRGGGGRPRAGRLDRAATRPTTASPGTSTRPTRCSARARAPSAGRGSARASPAGGAAPLDAHSLYLETLSELGLVGLLLLAAFVLVPFRRLVRSRGAPGAPAAAGAAVAFLAHAGVDWDWELPAVVVAGLACLAAVLLADGRASEEQPAGSRLRAAALAAALVLGAVSIAGSASKAEPSALARLAAWTTRFG